MAWKQVDVSCYSMDVSSRYGESDGGFMKCPYRKKTTDTVVFDGSVTREEHFCECYEHDCPFYSKWQSVNNPDSEHADCMRAEQERGFNRT